MAVGMHPKIIGAKSDMVRRDITALDVWSGKSRMDFTWEEPTPLHL